MNEPRYAWSDGPEHIVVRYGNSEHGYSVNLAKELHTQLGRAIEEAEQTPFLRWWKSIEFINSRGDILGTLPGTGVVVNALQAEELFNQIREAK